MSPASSRDPQVTGGFDLLRGSLALVGQRLTFTRGKVTFHGDVIPDLDLVAETTRGRHHRAHRGDRPGEPAGLHDHLARRACRRTRFWRGCCFRGRRAACRRSRRWSSPTRPPRSPAAATRSTRCASRWGSQPGHRDGLGRRPVRPRARDQRPDQRRRDDRRRSRRTTASTSTSTSPATSACRPASTRPAAPSVGVGADWEYK